MDSLCRDCDWTGASAPSRCPACASPRLVRHAELDRLAIAHLDCDAFYASVEKRDRPELRDLPVIVGGGKRGVVSTACYVARQYGVRSAMPMFKALQACPNAVVIKPDFSKYVADSRRIFGEVARLTPLVQTLSLDEAWIDLSGTERLNGGPPAAQLARLQRRIEQEIGLGVSIGLAPNTFLAKIASELDKPPRRRPSWRPVPSPSFPGSAPPSPRASPPTASSAWATSPAPIRPISPGDSASTACGSPGCRGARTRVRSIQRANARG
jgi:DNA polymerase-4